MNTKIILLYTPDAAHFPAHGLDTRFERLMHMESIQRWDNIDLDHLGKEAANKITNSDWRYTKNDILQPNGGNSLGKSFWDISYHVNEYLIQTYPIVDGVIESVMREDKTVVLMKTSILDAVIDAFASRFFEDDEIGIYAICVSTDEEDYWISKDSHASFDFLINEKTAVEIMNTFDAVVGTLIRGWKKAASKPSITSGFLGDPAPPEVGEIRYDNMAATGVNYEIQTHTPSNWMVITDWKSIEPPWCYGKVAID